MSKIDGLNINRELKEQIKENGFTTMTEIQQLCIPEMLKRRDVIVQSATGSGKTLAFLIPILHHICNDRCRSCIRAVIIAPTRELAMQIKGVLDSFGTRCECFIGGIDIEMDYKKMESPFDVVVGTPGRLLELMNWDRKRFSGVGQVVLDEADKLLGFGFEEKLLEIMRMLPKEKAVGLFSATINESVDRLSKMLLRNAVRLQARDSMPVDLELEYVVLKPVDKLMVLFDVIRDKKCIVFFATCNQVDFFFNLFVKLGFSDVNKMHGKMSQMERGRVYEDFVSDNKILFCTDVMARGMDFKDIGLVVHFDIPKDYNNIVHRSGRTARNGNKGSSLVFLMPNERAYSEFLKLKGISVVESRCERLNSPERYEDVKDKIDPKLLELSVKAFVSYIRSYKEHFVSYILDYRGLDFDSMASLFFLEKIPNMTELRNVKFERFTKPEKRSTESGEKKKKKKKSKNW